MFETFAMNEERVIALAGLFQACALTQQLATGGRCDEGAMEVGMASVFRIDAPSVVAVYGSVADVRVGLRALVAQLDESEPRHVRDQDGGDGHAPGAQPDRSPRSAGQTADWHRRRAAAG